MTPGLLNRDSHPASAKQIEVVIRPQKPFELDLRELWAYRELFYYFAWRDIKVRYKQTAIGALWAIFQPLVTMLVFTVVFNQVAGVKAPSGIPYPVFSYTGLLFWNFFSTSLTTSSNSLVANQGLISKIYFPRIISPFSASIVSLIDFCFAGLVYAGLLVYYGIKPELAGLLLILPMLIVTFIASSGMGMFFSALNVKYRDVRIVIPFFLNLLLFLTPIIYPITRVPHRFQWLLYLNPITGVIQIIRAAMLNEGSLQWHLLLISVLSTVVLFGSGFLYFRSQERRFADIV